MKEVATAVTARQWLGWRGEERRVLDIVIGIDRVFDFYATTPTAVFV